MKMQLVPCEAGKKNAVFWLVYHSDKCPQGSLTVHFNELALFLQTVMRVLSCNSGNFSPPNLLLIVIILRRGPCLVFVLCTEFVRLTENSQKYLLTCCVLYQSHCAVINTDPHCAICVVVFQRKNKLWSYFSADCAASPLLFEKEKCPGKCAAA